MKYVIDIDGTICKEVIIPDSGGKKDYANHIPMTERIAKVNALFDAGHTIKYMTARGCVSGIDYFDLTKKQLDEWGAKHHELSVGEKENYDIWIDDKAFWSENFFRETGESYE
jgi:CMP-N,N'-diacetyllegionaminic acid synthase